MSRFEHAFPFFSFVVFCVGCILFELGLEYVFRGTTFWFFCFCFGRKNVTFWTRFSLLFFGRFSYGLSCVWIILSSSSSSLLLLFLWPELFYFLLWKESRLVQPFLLVSCFLELPLLGNIFMDWTSYFFCFGNKIATYSIIFPIVYSLVTIFCLLESPILVTYINLESDSSSRTLEDESDAVSVSLFLYSLFINHVLLARGLELPFVVTLIRTASWSCTWERTFYLSISLVSFRFVDRLVFNALSIYSFHF